MYIAMLNTMSATIVVAIFQKLNLVYALCLCVFTVVGTIPGIMLQHYLVKKTKKPRVTVALLFGFIVFSVVANPIIAIINLVYRQ